MNKYIYIFLIFYNIVSQKKTCIKNQNIFNFNKKKKKIKIHFNKYILPYDGILISLFFSIIQIVNIILLKFDNYFYMWKLIINFRLMKDQQNQQLIYLFNKYLLIINLLILLNIEYKKKNFNKKLVKKYLFIYKIFIIFLISTYIIPNKIIYHRYFFYEIYHFLSIIMTVLIYLSILLILKNQYEVNLLKNF